MGVSVGGTRRLNVRGLSIAAAWPSGGTIDGVGVGVIDTWCFRFV